MKKKSGLSKKTKTTKRSMTNHPKIPTINKYHKLLEKAMNEGDKKALEIIQFFVGGLNSKKEGTARLYILFAEYLAKEWVKKNKPKRLKKVAR